MHRGGFAPLRCSHFRGSRRRLGEGGCTRSPELAHGEGYGRQQRRPRSRDRNCQRAGARANRGGSTTIHAPGRGRDPTGPRQRRLGAASSRTPTSAARRTLGHELATGSPARDSRPSAYSSAGCHRSDTSVGAGRAAPRAAGEPDVVVAAVHRGEPTYFSRVSAGRRTAVCDARTRDS